MTLSLHLRSIQPTLQSTTNHRLVNVVSTHRFPFRKRTPHDFVLNKFGNENIDQRYIETLGRESIVDYTNVQQTVKFLFRAMLVGIFTGIGIVIFKTLIASVTSIFYEYLADFLPKPSFYWPLALYPILGSVAVCIISFITGPSIKEGVDSIAQSIDYIPLSNAYNVLNISKYLIDPLENSMPTPSTNMTELSNTLVGDIGDDSDASAADSLLVSDRVSEFNNITAYMPAITEINNVENSEINYISLISPKVNIRRINHANIRFDPLRQFLRLMASVATLGSGCALGPEGPAVEIGKNSIVYA